MNHEGKRESDVLQGMLGIEEGSPYPILAPATVADERTRVLKHDDTVGIFDHYGDVKPGGLGEEGLFHEDTRYLSCLLTFLEKSRPFYLSSTVFDENDQLAVDLTNPDLLRGDVRVPLGTVHFAIKKLLWRAVCYQEMRIKNHGLEPLTTYLSLFFRADYADIFEVRGTKRKARGKDLTPEVTRDQVILGYRGLDGVVRRTIMKFSPPPAALGANSARFNLVLEPQQEVRVNLSIACERQPARTTVLDFEQARAEVEADRERFRAWSCHLHTYNGQVNAWINRTMADLHMMMTNIDDTHYPYAGVPWFSTAFGRDGIITALECLWIRPSLTRGVLKYLAERQSKGIDRTQDAEPGKIMHETRKGEMAVLKEVPFGMYYGSVDSTPLFVLLAGAYYERTADRAFIEQLWPHVDAALQWMDKYGDRDGDGFLEYDRQSVNGLIQQGWKDSDDAVFHADGSLARAPIALCEVQAYAYGARRAGAMLAKLLGHNEQATQLQQQAEALRKRFEDMFWCDDISTYALALDGDKRPCRVRTSNAGQCLFTGIAAPDRAARLAQTLLSPESFSGWGVRTVASNEARYNPMSYHNGSVWPHDNALIALGLSRYGLGGHALQIWNGMFEASRHLDLHRLPELFCGFASDVGEAPILYPVACAPQAWSAASVFLLFQACLGLTINAPAAQVFFNRARLPTWLQEMRIHNLRIGEAALDLRIVRHDHDVSVNVLRREGDVQIMSVK